MTADDLAVSRKAMEQDINVIEFDRKCNKRARQNVFFEMGYFIGRLGRSRVFELMEEGVEVPSDLAGIIYTPLDSEDMWKYKLAKRLKAVGYDINTDRIL